MPLKTVKCIFFPKTKLFRQGKEKGCDDDGLGTCEQVPEKKTHFPLGQWGGGPGDDIENE